MKKINTPAAVVLSALSFGVFAADAERNAVSGSTKPTHLIKTPDGDTAADIASGSRQADE